MRILAAVVLALVAACAPVKPDPDFSQIRGATRELQATNPNDATDVRGFCSGVMIAKSQMLTAAHCDLSERGIKMSVAGHPATVVRKDEARDVMLLQVDAGCPCVSAVSAPDVDQAIYVVGFPLNYGMVLTEGRYEGPVLHPDENTGEGMILITAPVTYGNSGGGVFAIAPTGEWVLVGILSRGTNAPGFMPVTVPHLNLAVGFDSIMKILKA